VIRQRSNTPTVVAFQRSRVRSDLPESVDTVKRQRMATAPVPIKTSGRSLNYSEMCERIWGVSGALGIKSKNDLERAIRDSNVVMLPDKADEDMAIAAYLHNKKEDNIKRLITDRGRQSVSDYVNMWKDKIDVVLENIRKR